MKKSVILMVGFMAMALAGSAQAAPMFAVQDGLGADKFTVDATGDAAGNNVTLTGKFAGGLQNVPVPSGFTAPTAGFGVFHYATAGKSTAEAAFLIQAAVTPTTAGLLDFNQQSAGNFSFYRVNKSDAVPPVYSLPTSGAYLGYVNFGTIDPAADPAISRSVTAQLVAKAEAGGTTNLNAWKTITNTPTYLSFWTTNWTGSANNLSEKMRLTSDGKLGIGVVGAPTSKLQVVGLPVCPDNTTAKAAAPGGCGIGVGGFYLQGPVGGVTTTGAVFVAF